MNRKHVFAAATVLLLASAIGYAVLARENATTAAGTGRIDLSQRGQIVFRDAGGYVASVPLGSPGGPRTVSPLACARVSVTSSGGVCLIPGVTTFDATLVDSTLSPGRRIAGPGAPNRARVSTDGTQVAWTAFVTGHSYAGSDFSTRTSILDGKTGKYYGDLETLPLYREGARLRAPDLNLWGVTFKPDGKGFYASISTGGQTYLIEAGFEAWEGRTLLSNVECPSLAPDGRHLVFKQRIAAPGTRPWRLAVLSLDSMQVTALPGTQGIDDQAVWLDGGTVIYAMDSHIWAVPIDGSREPHVLVANAESPSVLA